MKINYLDISFKTLFILCFIQLFFVTSVIYITTDLLIRSYNAYSYLSITSSIPVATIYRPLIVGSGCIALVIIMKLRSKTREHLMINIGLISLEIIICFLIMYATSYSTNAVILIVLANMFRMTEDRDNRIVALIIFIILFVLSNYNIMSYLIDINSLESYLSVYNHNARSLLNVINNLLYTLNIMAFIFYMLFLIQNQFNESQKIKALNDELNDLNIQLKGYAEIKEKMGETRERNRIAREIHDTLGHTLTGLATGIDACKTIVGVDANTALKQLEILSDVAKEGLKDVRRSVSKLRIDALENHTLKYALEKMISEYEHTTGVTIHFMCHLSSLEFQSDEEEAIYRIVQESTTNAIRHGKASEIYISFGMDRDNLIIIIEDNGTGCQNVKEGFGLHHMKERVKLLSGTVRYYSTAGFTVIVEVPVRKEK